MTYGIWLSWNNQQEGFQIPVNPASIEISESGNGKTYDITKSGEINVIQSPKLTEISFDSIFPAVRYPFVTAETLRAPMWYVEHIKKWMETKRPIRFVFTGSHATYNNDGKLLTADINLPVSIEKFSWKESAGSPGDIEYELSLKRYVFYSAQKVVVNKTGTSAAKAPTVQSQPPARQNDTQPPKTYTLVAGDNLWKVAKKMLGDGSRWKELQKLNQISDAQLTKLKIGMVIKLP